MTSRLSDLLSVGASITEKLRGTPEHRLRNVPEKLRGRVVTNADGAVISRSEPKFPKPNGEPWRKGRVNGQTCWN